MGKKLDALLGRNFKTSKFKTLSQLAGSRLAILSNQHQIRLSQARSDVKELLLLGQQDRALLRVEHVIMEQNMLDAFSLIEFFCQVLLERVKLIAQSKGECPQELKEAASSLIYAASRCGEFPELQKIREVLTANFGKDFATRAVELRNNCEVHPKIVQKFSTRRPSLENKLKFLKEIAPESGVTVNLEEYAPVKDALQEKLGANQKQGHTEPTKALNSLENSFTRKTPLFEDIKEVEKISESMKARRKYIDAADAAQEAFESAAYAAAAARAAVELSMSRSKDNKNQHDSDNQGGTVADINAASTDKALIITSSAASEKIECLVNRLSFEKIHPVQDLGRLESEVEDNLANESLDDFRPEEEAEKEKKATERKSTA